MPLAPSWPSRPTAPSAALGCKISSSPTLKVTILIEYTPRSAVTRSIINGDLYRAKGFLLRKEHPMSANWREVAQKVRNWGKWGPDDQLGTLNYITPEKIARTTAMVKQGRVIPLSIPVDAYGPQ